MNTRKPMSGIIRGSLCAAVAGVGFIASASVSIADDRLVAENVSASAGQPAAVPITIKLGADNVAFFGATFTVTPQGAAPAIVEKLAYQAAGGSPAPDLQTAVQADAKLAIGYVGVTISPPLSGTARIGTLTVPIPAGASGTYKVEVSKVSAGDSSGNKISITGQAGTITIGGDTRSR
ncbi:MAG TPA: hypothetical protein VMW56_13500 [Candidatus Margulisiibacteriota bacterium]|nr:hypothetical protein [Candidatus Margulisiibacteriota bacterium]